MNISSFVRKRKRKKKEKIYLFNISLLKTSGLRFLIFDPQCFIMVNAYIPNNSISDSYLLKEKGKTNSFKNV